MNKNYNKLRGRIKEKFGTQKAFSKAVGIGYVSLSERLNGKLDFTTSDIATICKTLEIDIIESPKYFFSN